MKTKLFLILFIFWISNVFAQKKEEIVVQSGHYNQINHLIFSSDNKFVASSSADATLRIWHIGTGRLFTTFQHNKPVIASCFNQENNNIASISQDGKLRVWDIENSLLIKEVEISKNIALIVCRLAYYEKKIFVQINNDIYEVSEDYQTKKINNENITAFQLQKNGNISYLSSDNILKNISDNQGLQIPIHKLKRGHYDFGVVREIYTILFDKIFFIEANRLASYDYNTKKKLKIKGDYLDDVFTSVAFSPLNSLIIATNTDSNIYLIDSQNGKIIKKLSTHLDDVQAVSINQTQTMFATAGNDRSIIIWDLKQQKPIQTLYSKTYKINTMVSISEKNRLAWGDEVGNLKILQLDDRNFQIIAKKAHKYPLVSLTYQNNVFQSIGNDNRLKTIDTILTIKSDRKIRKRFVPTYWLLNKFGYYYEYPQMLVLPTLSKCEIKDYTFIANFGAIEVFQKNDSIKNNGLKIDNGLKIATIIPLGSKQNKICITPDNYYLADKATLENSIAFKVGMKMFLPDQFDLQYNRPDIVLERMGFASKELIESYRKAYEKRLKKLNFDPKNFEKDKSFNAPELQLKNQESLVQEVKTAIFPLNFEAKDALFNLDRLNLYVNGVPIFGTKGQDLKEKNTKNYAETLKIELSKGKNLIELSVLNEKGVESLKEKLEVNFVAENAQNAQKPVLHLVTIGVSEYENTQMNLKYATKDGKDLASLLQRQVQKKKNVFQSVKYHALFDKDATKENIINLKKELQKTNINDVVMVFVSGHGLLDSELDYFLATNNVDFDNPKAKGLPYDELENLLDSIPARQKILMMDACHSGEIDKEEIALVVKNEAISNDKNIKFKNFDKKTVTNKNVGLQNSFELSKQMFTDLRKGSGTTVLSAAGGVQLAQESSEWQNGAFTYCVLSGLKNMKADLNKDGKIMLSELQNYLFTEVPKITGGLQQPTSRIENLINDFRIW